MTFYTNMSLPDGSWESTKTVYDPCPAGWRVPEGGGDGVWAKALGSSNSVSMSFDSKNRGINFTGAYGDSECIWYPNSGYRDQSDGGLSYVNGGSHSWSCSPYESNSNIAYYLNFSYSGQVSPSNYYNRASGYPVRCLQVID